jgi:hypothetical protein
VYTHSIFTSDIEYRICSWQLRLMRLEWLELRSLKNEVNELPGIVRNVECRFKFSAVCLLDGWMDNLSNKRQGHDISKERGLY